MDDKPLFETRRQRVMKILQIPGTRVNTQMLMVEFEYPSKRVLLEDIQKITKTLASKGLTVLMDSPYCEACNYRFSLDRNRFKIPSKCPKCKQQRIAWPTLMIQK